MAKYLKADTAAIIKIGPFVDSTDGVTAETALTIAQADVRISKNGGNIAQKAEATSATHDELGYYNCPLGTGDTDSEGTLSVFVSESGALPVRHDFIVLPAKVYDSLVLGTDDLEVDVVKQLGTAITPAYQAIVGVYQLAGEQVYAVSWLKNGVPVTIATPTIQITTLAASPANLLDTAGDGEEPMTIVGSSNVAFFVDEDESLTSGTGYRYVVTATIDAAERTFQGTLVLDSSSTAMTSEQVAQAVWRRTSAQLGVDETSAGANSSAALIRDMVDVLTDTAAMEPRTQTIAGNVSFVRNELAGLRITGTVTPSGGTTTAVTADFDFDLAANALAGRVIVFPNGTLPNRRITANTAGAESTLTFDSALPSAPGDGVEFAVLGYVEPAS